MSKLDATTSGPALLTQAAYAGSRKARGLSGGTREAVRQAVEAGRISAIGPDKLIDPRVADVQWEQNSRKRAVAVNVPAQAAPVAPPAAPDGPAMTLFVPGEGVDVASGAATPPGPDLPAPEPGGYADSRARRERADAEQAEMKAARMAGSLVDRAAVELAVSDAFAALRDRVMAVPRRSAPAVVGLSDVRAVEARMEADLRGAFEAYEAQMRANIAARITQ